MAASGKFNLDVFVQVSDNPHIKVLAGALFPSSVIGLGKISKGHIFVMKIIAICITSEPALL